MRTVLRELSPYIKKFDRPYLSNLMMFPKGLEQTTSLKHPKQLMQRDKQNQA